MMFFPAFSVESNYLWDCLDLFLCNVCMSGLVKLFHILLSDRIQICRSLIYSTKASIKTQCYIMQMSNYNSIVLIKNSQTRFNMMTSNMQSFTCFFFLCFKKNTSSQAFQNMLLFTLLTFNGLHECQSS